MIYILKTLLLKQLIDNEKSPFSYLKHFYVDSLVHSTESFKFLLNQIGSENIALGSDYPFPLGEQIPGSIINKIDELSNKDKENIFHNAALKWLDLDKKLFI